MALPNWTEVLGVEQTAPYQMNQLAQGRATVEHTQAQTQLARLSVQREQLEIAQQQKMAQVLSQMGQTGGQTEDLASRYEKAAQAMADAGLIGQSEELAKTSSGLRYQQSEILAAKARTENSMAEAETRNLKLADQLLSRSGSQEELEANNTLYTMLTGRKSPLLGQPWSPALIQHHIDQNLAEQGKVTNALRERKEQSEEQARLATEAHQRATLALAEKRNSLYKERTERLGKTGSVKLPSVEEKAGTDLVKSRYGHLGDEEARVLGRELAEGAQRIKATNQALTMGQARAQSFQEMQKNGRFSALTPVAKGHDQSTPAELPKDRKALQQNTWYDIPGKGPRFLQGNELLSPDELSDRIHKRGGGSAYVPSEDDEAEE